MILCREPATGRANEIAPNAAMARPDVGGLAGAIGRLEVNYAIAALNSSR
jgi:hypothetical protein